MGGELLTSPQGGEQSPPVKYSEVFYEYEPWYLFLGMTESQYWNGDCTLVKKYRKAYEYKKEQQNYESWLQGLYIYEALLNVSPMFHDFIKKPKPFPYPDKPYALSRKEQKQREKSKEQEDMEKLMDSVREWSIKIKKKKAGENKDG